jgi:hypothetical protein
LGIEWEFIDGSIVKAHQHSAMVAHCLLVLLGHIIIVKMPKFLKNSALMASVVLAYFLSEKKLHPYLQKDS